jgi:hypothetical protein
MRLWSGDLPGQHGGVENVSATPMQQDEKRLSQLQDLGEGSMKVLDLWCGTKSATQAFHDAGFDVVSVDINEKFNPTICKDIIDVTVDELLDHGPFVFGWASVECKVYSIANLHSKHWKTDQAGVKAVTEEAREMNERVKHTIALLSICCPTFVIENPRGMLRKQPFMNQLPRHTVSYCTYGDSRQKPTDLWGKFPQYWTPRRMCSPNASCHESAPRGTSDSGTLALSYEDRIKVPYDLGVTLREAGIKANWEPQPTLEDY